MTKVSKPLAAAIQGLIMWLVLCWVSHVEHIFSFSVVGVGTAYMLTMISAFRKSLERKEHFEAAIMVLGFLSCIALYYYCWIGLGGAVLDRLQVLAPVIIFMVLGLIMHRMKWLHLG